MTNDEFKEAQARLGLTNVEMSKACGVTFGTIQTWRSGKSPVSRIAQILIERMINEDEEQMLNVDYGMTNHLNEEQQLLRANKLRQRIDRIKEDFIILKRFSVEPINGEYSGIIQTLTLASEESGGVVARLYGAHSQQQKAEETNG